MAALADTNVLVYRYDPRFPQKQRIAEGILRQGIAQGDLYIPHQAVVEFFSVVTRPLGSAPSLLTRDDAYRETEDLLNLFPVLYPNDAVVRTAIRGAAVYGLSWFDAHLWAFAEVHGIPELLSEDFQHDRLYGSVRVQNPFAGL